MSSRPSAVNQEALERGLLGGSECVLWPKPDAKGYGRTRHNGKLMTAHKRIWLMAGRDIPARLSLDHICHDPTYCSGGNQCVHRSCVNIDHLRLATPKEQVFNSVVKYRDYCRNGHPWIEENISTKPNGGLFCRICRKEYRQNPKNKSRVSKQRSERLKKKRETVPPGKSSTPGEMNGRSILTEEIVLEIRRLRSKGMRGSEIAERLGQPRSRVYSVLTGKTWKHLLK